MKGRMKIQLFDNFLRICGTICLVLGVIYIMLGMVLKRYLYKTLQK